jgi:hypothetical protein
MVKALGLERLPALVHLAVDGTLVDSAEGWRPSDWRRVCEELAEVLSWRAPNIPTAKDPAPYEGTRALA